MWTLLRCLWSDVLHGWRESPGAPLSRAGVAALLSGVAAAVLLAFLSAQSSMERMLRSFGDRTVTVSEFRNSGTPQLHPALPSLMAECGGRRVHLCSAPLSARVFGQACPVYAYDTLEAGLLSDLGPQLAMTPRLLLSDAFPPGAELEVEWSPQSVSRLRVVPRPAWFARLSRQTAVLVPLSDLPKTATGVDITHVEAESPAAAARLASRLRTLRQALGAAQAEIQDASAIQSQLAAATAARDHWRLLLLASVIPALALVLGTLSVLEFRQTQYAAALLRSQGASPLLLWLRRLVEDAVVVGLAGGGVLLGMAAYAPEFLGALGTASVNWGPADAQRFLVEDGRWIFLGLWAGVSIGSLPVAVGLCKPVGRVLP